MTATKSSDDETVDAGSEGGGDKTVPKKKKTDPPPKPKPKVLTLHNGTINAVRIAVCIGGVTTPIMGKIPWKIVGLIGNETKPVVPPESFDATIQWTSMEKSSSVEASIPSDKKHTVQITEVLKSGDSPITATGLTPKSGKISLTYTPFLDMSVTLKSIDGEIVRAPVSFMPRSTLTLDVNDYQIVVVTDSAELGKPLRSGQVRPNAFHMKAGQTALLTGPFQDGYVFGVFNTAASS